MLELSEVDLGALAEALEDHSDDTSWYLEPSGAVVPWCDELDEPSPDQSGAYYIDPIPSLEAYRDMQDFVAQVPDRRAFDLLARAIEGRGAFRRFKDTLFEFPELRQSWFDFHDVRMRRRAIEWLVDVKLVDDSAGEAALEQLVDPVVGEGVIDPVDLARDIATELGQLFGDRLVDVVLFGSYASDAATDESDLDLAVVMRDVVSPWEDAKAMDDLLWAKTLESGITVSALVVDAADWTATSVPVIRSAKEHGRSIR
jgi:predicted nucleotidyltransferase